MLIQAAINGSRTKTEHPAIPVTAEQQAQESRAAVAAGSSSIHVHVRDASGIESLKHDDVTRCLDTIRAACPNTPIGVSTGAWIVRDANSRLSLVRAWTTLPDFASVNVHEDGAIELMRVLLDKGIGVEAGVWNGPAADIFMRSGITDKVLRICLELLDTVRDPLTQLEEIEARLKGTTRPRLLHGVDANTWDVIAIAADRRYDTRIGLEDTVTLPNGSPPADNGDLVAAARHIMGSPR
jgi:uncharacterized protein (DUF849 family)